MEQVILWILGVGAVIGGIDRLAGNRFGLGEKFEEGFCLLGQTALSMAGILCLAPLLSGALEHGGTDNITAVLAYDGEGEA